jgi:hypothetical protein
MLVVLHQLGLTVTADRILQQVHAYAINSTFNTANTAIQRIYMSQYSLSTATYTSCYC